jgi:hypothetical protein
MDEKRLDGVFSQPLLAYEHDSEMIRMQAQSKQPKVAKHRQTIESMTILKEDRLIRQLEVLQLTDHLEDHAI